MSFRGTLCRGNPDYDVLLNKIPKIKNLLDQQIQLNWEEYIEFYMLGSHGTMCLGMTFLVFTVFF